MNNMQIDQLADQVYDLFGANGGDGFAVTTDVVLQALLGLAYEKNTKDLARFSGEVSRLYSMMVRQGVIIPPSSFEESDELVELV